MKIEGTMTLGQALAEIEARAREMRESGVLPNGQRLRLERRVSLDIEFEREKDEYELEFEVKWKRKPRGFWKRVRRLVLR